MVIVLAVLVIGSVVWLARRKHGEIPATNSADSGSADPGVPRQPYAGDPVRPSAAPWAGSMSAG